MIRYNLAENELFHLPIEKIDKQLHNLLNLKYNSEMEKLVIYDEQIDQFFKKQNYEVTVSDLISKYEMNELEDIYSPIQIFQIIDILLQQHDNTQISQNGIYVNCVKYHIIHLLIQYATTILIFNNKNSIEIDKTDNGYKYWKQLIEDCKEFQNAIKRSKKYKNIDSEKAYYCLYPFFKRYYIDCVTNILTPLLNVKQLKNDIEFKMLIELIKNYNTFELNSITYVWKKIEDIFNIKVKTLIRLEHIVEENNIDPEFNKNILAMIRNQKIKHLTNNYYNNYYNLLKSELIGTILYVIFNLIENSENK